ncbi:MAG: cell division protein SepF [Erysipelotrichaceae bacterium]|nr:cell division protein SepF [Erysipelotrichaceae bacterium]
MGIKNMFGKLFQNEEADEIEEELEITREEAKAISSYEEPRTKINKMSSDTKMVLFEPRSFDEVEEIAKHLKQRRACVVNLHRLQRDYAQRTIDFLTGTVFALDGTIQKIAHNTILLTPSSIGVDGAISLDNNEY